MINHLPYSLEKQISINYKLCQRELEDILKVPFGFVFELVVKLYYWFVKIVVIGEKWKHFLFGFGHSVILRPKNEDNLMGIDLFNFVYNWIPIT